MIEERYNRQELITGWKQEILTDARITILGTNLLSQNILLSLSALGIGTLEIYENQRVYTTEKHKKSLLTLTGKKGESYALCIEKMLQKINPSTFVKGMNIDLSEYTIPLIGTPTLLIDATNNEDLKRISLQYAIQKNIHYISTSADDYSGIINIYTKDTLKKENIQKKEEKKKKNDFHPYFNQLPNGIIGGILGGMIIEEVRKILLPLEKTEEPIKKIMYSCITDERFISSKKLDELLEKREKEKDANRDIVSDSEIDQEPNSSIYEKKGLQNKKALIIGAGALGNFVALGLTYTHINSIDIMDYDTVETTNLNRQILFYDAVGKNKASALCEKIKEINNSIKVKDFCERLDEKSNYFNENNPDIIFDCVDSFAVRAYINYFAVKHKIPLVSGGTNSKSGQIITYIPNKTSCLDCKIHVEKALAEHLQAASCKFAPDSSVIMTNQIIGSMMVSEGINIFFEQNPLAKIFKYDSTAETRGGLIGSSSSCSCTKSENPHDWISSVMSKYEMKK